MTSFLKKNIPILDKYKHEVIWQSIKFFRDANLNKWAIDVYNGIPNGITFSAYEKRCIDFSYFSSRLAILDEKLPSDLLDYLHKERENILDGETVECLPWLISLYNIKRSYPNSDFSDTGLGYYAKVFESIIPSEDYKRHKDIIFGDSEASKKELKISLKKLLKTRSISDFYYDNYTALMISSRMIQDSFLKQNIESVLLLMMVKSDYSILFAEEDGSEFSSFKVNYDDLNFIDSIYSDEKKVAQNLSKKNNEISWFAVSEEDVFQLILNEGDFTFHSLDKWDWKRFKELEKNSYFSELQFDDTIKDHNGVRQISNEEYLEASLDILKRVQFSDIKTTPSSKNLFVIKDMKLASFPHNLLLSNNEFIHSKKGIANILSTEWYSSVKDQTYLNQDFSKSIWIPTEKGDFTLNHLFGSLEEQLSNQSFTIYQNSDLEKPINSDLNIICSHGSSEIAKKQVFYSSSQSPHEPGKIIGEGEILVFFVCHSGSYSKEYLRNNINSIVKSAIIEGYKAVIAPFWSLHVNIPKIWLSSFIESMNQGNQIVKSVFEANSAVAKKFPTPSAWAAMHLYGNPHLRTPS